MPAAAFVLAAGLGTRLRPLTDHRPKPLVPVCGVPVLDQALALCLRHGLREVVVNAHHRAGQVADHLARVLDLRIHLQVEHPAILGTGGGLRAARDRLGERFAVVNGDILCDADLGALLAALDLPDTDAAMLLRRSEDAARLGVVAADAEGRVVRLAAVATHPDRVPVASDTHFTGIHALERGVLDRVPGEGSPCIVRTAYRALVPEGRVAGLLHGGTWTDVGSPADYLQANLDALDGRLALPLDPWSRAGRAARGDRVHGSDRQVDVSPRAVLVPPYWLGPGVAVEAGAVVGPGVVLGDGARVGRDARLERVVAWDGVAVPAGARLRDAVVHDGGVLEVGA